MEIIGIFNWGMITFLSCYLLFSFNLKGSIVMGCIIMILCLFSIRSIGINSRYDS